MHNKASDERLMIVTHEHTMIEEEWREPKTRWSEVTACSKQHTD